MILDDVLNFFKFNWPKNMCYSNILRKKGYVNLTGVHMVLTKKYYTDNLIKHQKKIYKKNGGMNDEKILGLLCEGNHKLVPFDYRFRPIIGIHFYPNRGPNKMMELMVNNYFKHKFLTIRNHNLELFKFKIFDDLYKQLIYNFIIKKTELYVDSDFSKKPLLQHKLNLPHNYCLNDCSFYLVDENGIKNKYGIKNQKLFKISNNFVSSVAKGGSKKRKKRKNKNKITKKL